MKAILYKEYGDPSVLKLKDVESPKPKDREVLVKVKAASVNSWDWDLMRGSPFIVRIVGGGWRKPKKQILGCDFAGVVLEIGEQVTQFKVGDEVFGDNSGGNWGGFAEYACAKEKEMIMKPASMSFEEAAAIPQAGVLALQGLRDVGKIEAGHKVLINGAGGGVGAFAIQLAKMYGAEVTAVDSSLKLESMKSIGADHVIDYAKKDFTLGDTKYDIVMDVVVNHTRSEYERILTDSGRLVMIGGNMTRMFLFAIRSWLFRSRKKLVIMPHTPNQKDLNYLTELMNSGNIRTVIDKSYPLEDAPIAMRRLGESSAIGKVVITLS